MSSSPVGLRETLLSDSRSQGVNSGTQRSSRKLSSRPASATSPRTRRARRALFLFPCSRSLLTLFDRHVLKWLDGTQIRTNPKHFKEAYRHPTKGAWPFSTKEQGYTVSDCAAEGMKAVMLLQGLPCVSSPFSLFPTDEFSRRHAPQLVSKERLCDTVDIILGLQNPGGGFASYELIRGPAMLEQLNPAEVFGNIMIEYDYPECTTACEFLSLVVRGVELMILGKASRRSRSSSASTPTTALPISIASRKPRSSTSTLRSARMGAGTEAGGSASPTPPCLRSNREFRAVSWAESLLMLVHVRKALAGRADVRELEERAEGVRVLAQQADGGRRVGRELQGAFSLAVARSSTNAASPVVRDRSLRSQPRVASRQHRFRRHRAFLRSSFDVG